MGKHIISSIFSNPLRPITFEVCFLLPFRLLHQGFLISASLLVVDSHEKEVSEILKSYGKVKREGTLLTVTYFSIYDYLFYLRVLGSQFLRIAKPFLRSDLIVIVVVQQSQHQL